MVPEVLREYCRTIFKEEMSLLDEIGKTDVRRDLVRDCPYEINDDVNLNELLKNSPYRLHLLFCETFKKDELISLCEDYSEDLIENLSYVPNISELSNVCIVKNKKYKLMIGMNFYRMSPYSAIWTFALIIEMMKRSHMCINDTKINICGLMSKYKINYIEYGEFVESYHQEMNYLNYIKIHSDRGYDRYRFGMEMRSRHRRIIEYLTERWIYKKEWEQCVNKSYERYKKIYPVKMKA